MKETETSPSEDRSCGRSASIGCGCGSATRRSSRRFGTTGSATTSGTSASPSWPGSPSGSRGACSCDRTSSPCPTAGSTRSMRFGVFIPMLLVGFGLTFTPLFRRIWQWMSVVIATLTHPGVGLLRLARPDAARGVRLRRRHPDHGVHLHPPAAAVPPGRAGHGDRHRRLPPVRVHGAVHRRGEPGARHALPRLVRGPGWSGGLSTGTVHDGSCSSASAQLDAGAGAIRRPAAEHPAAGHRRAAQGTPPAGGSPRRSTR